MAWNNSCRKNMEMNNSRINLTRRSGAVGCLVARTRQHHVLTAKAVGSKLVRCPLINILCANLGCSCLSALTGSKLLNSQSE